MAVIERFGFFSTGQVVRTSKNEALRVTGSPARGGFTYLDATLLDYTAALHAAAREAAPESGGGSWIAQPGTPSTSQVTGGDSSYESGPSHIYFLQGAPRQQVLLFEGGPPDRVLQALQEVLRRKD